MTTKRIFEASILLSAALLGSPGGLCADNIRPRPMIAIGENVVVRSERIKLPEIARLYEGDPSNAELVSRLKNIELGDSPAPKTKALLLGAQVLDALAKAGVSQDRIGYSIPKSINIEREGRVLAMGEVLAAVRSMIAEEKTLDLQVRDVMWANEQVLPSGETKIRVERLGEPASGKLPIRVEVDVDGRAAARFLASAMVDDWREVPVLNRPLERGSLVQQGDLQLVRVNLFKQPQDVASKQDEIVGHRLKSGIGAGEMVRKSNLDIPPTIPKGTRVTMIYTSGGLSATATGIAIEDGLEGAKIKVRNESSKRIIEAFVTGPGEVQVR